ncbi:Aspartic proteinase-like protein 1 [Morella rubra]|uniref:Aspartic proteinase-like protein 1 n=1 Tax=Morella rubra TaxID=262757 RepID=A0A6A1UIH3_9ROSI|nr:Aspartic proteinase-like protein 1 [Morella rubra]
MANWTRSTSPCTSIIFVLLLSLGSPACYVSGATMGFDMYHRFSEPVKRILGTEGLPEKGTIEYYVAMAHRDRSIHARRLLDAGKNQSPLTFANGNETFHIDVDQYLYYANVSVGTPSLSFLVALDTGSSLFWLPCDCNSSTDATCQTTSIYSPSTGQLI